MRSVLKIITLTLFSIFYFYANSRNEKFVNLDSLTCDCRQAPLLILKANSLSLSKNAPYGFGSKQEITLSDKNPYVFADEHNTHWYQLEVAVEGELFFEVIPNNTKDDYDFILYKNLKNLNEFCEEVNGARPIRSNISSNDGSNNGITGLKSTSNDLFVKKGKGVPYSKSILIKPHEKYILVIDVAKKPNSGYKLIFNILPNSKQNVIEVVNDNKEKLRPVLITTQMKNFKGEPLKGKFKVRLSGWKWDIPSQYEFMKYNDKTGKFEMKWEIEQKKLRCLVFYNEKSFFRSFVINREKIDSAINNKTIQLDTIKKGDRYDIMHFTFFYNSDKLENDDINLVLLESLLEIMKLNPALQIQLIGYSDEKKESLKDLGKARAQSIKKFLVKRGVEELRVKVDGKQYATGNDFTPQSKYWDQKIEVIVLKI